MAGSAGNLVMQSATALSPQVVSAQYQIQGSLNGPMTLGIYRAPTASFSSSDMLVGQAILQNADLAPGPHQVTVSLSQTLDINPSEKFVLAVADPADQVPETSKTDNVASFRTWIVGAVTHGYEIDGQFPTWVTSTASALVQSAGYDTAIAFNWAPLSAIPAPGAVPQAAQAMTVQINQAIAALPLQPGDVVDLHLIGHSRGGDVVSVVAGLLNRSMPPLSGGYLKLTLLDPHPALNLAVPYFSSSNGPVGTLAQADFVAFQAAANDPPLTIPSGVNSTEIFYQHTLVPDAVRPDEKFVDSWGEVPAGGATAGVVYYNMTGIVNSHEGLHDFYLQQIVPLLATGAPLPILPSPVPTVPTNSGPAFPNKQAGTRYEYRLLTTNGVPVPVAIHLLRSFTTLNSMLVHQKFPAADSQIKKMDRFIGNQSGRGLPALAATYLQEQLAASRILLFPHPSAPTRAARTITHRGQSAPLAVGAHSRA